MNTIQIQERFYLGLKGAVLIALPFLFSIVLLLIILLFSGDELSSKVVCPILILFFAYLIFDAFTVCLEISEDGFTLSYWGQRQSVKYSEIEKLVFAYEKKTGFDAIQVFSYSGTEIFIRSSYFDQFWEIMKLLIANASKKNVINIDQKILNKINS